MACNPVKYSDLGKDAKDLINKSFDFGVVKLEGKTKSKSGMVRSFYFLVLDFFLEIL